MYDPSKKEKAAMWRQISKHKPATPMTGAIQLDVDFYFKRPKSHYRTGRYKDLIKDDYKNKLHKISRPDLDNCIKMIADVIQGENRIITDDSQISIINARKWYATNNQPRTEITIKEIL